MGGRRKQPRLTLDRCVASYVTADTWRVLDLYDLWRTFGRFPVEADLIDQDAAMMDAFRIFEVERQSMSEEPLTAGVLVDILGAAFGGKR
ncbi:MAG TPA: hypothetical protein VI942_01710 [Thermoanaerobaculia bacterium]|nr:hypothetical protein [Thermoanaerobaculia bacterium]